MLNESFQRLHYGVNRFCKASTASLIRPLVFYCVCGYFASGLTAKGDDCRIEPRFAVIRDIIPNFGGLDADLVNTCGKIVSELIERGTFGPRSEAAHKAFEVVNARFLRGFSSVLSISGVTANGEKMTKESSEESAAQERHNGLQKTLCSSLVWHFFLAVLGGFLGYAGYFRFREWWNKEEAQNFHTDGHPNTSILHMTYIV